MACCWNRGAENLLPGGQDTEFDRQLIVGFGRILDQGGVLRTSPAKIQRRTLEGSLGLIAQFSEEHFSKKRSTPEGGLGDQVLAESVDPAAFNFNKVSTAERICEVEAFPEEHPAGSMRVAVLANISPLATGHTLLVPQGDALRPQVLTEELLYAGLHLLAKSSRRDFRLVFNSLLAFASVNHFHFHGLFLNYHGLQNGSLPIERAPRSVIAGKTTEGCTQIELIVGKAWYCHGFVVTAGCKPGEPGETPPADLAALAATAGKVVQELQRRNLAHNVIIAPPTLERRRKRDNNALMAHEEVATPFAISPEVIIIPRKSERSLRGDAGFNAAILEVSGVLVCHGEEAYNSFNEATVQEIFREDVALSDEVFDDLICKVAWLPA